MTAPSISVFFPAYNDAGTIASMVILALETLKELTDDYEVIVIDDGSKDDTRLILQLLQQQYPEHVRPIFHEKNKGYGGALRSGFAHATKDLIFYTDGDAQYDVKELHLLYNKFHEGVDLVNGWKRKRHDPWFRILIGKIYQNVIKISFSLQLRDVDCDFRLMRRSIFEKVTLESNSGVICVEMMKKIQDAGFRLDETPVSHFHRLYGRSQFFNWRRLLRVARDLVKLWWHLVVKKEHLQERG